MAVNARWRWWWAASLLVHASAVSVAITAAPTRAVGAQSPDESWVAFEVPDPREPTATATAGSTEQSPDVDPQRPQMRFGGSRSAQNVSSENPGERGDGMSPQRGRLLAARDDGVNLDPRLLNNFDAAQEQRIRTARVRASPQDDRRTPHPDIDPWLATGHGILLYRVPNAAALPAQGAQEHVGASVQAGSARHLAGETEQARPETLAGAAPRLGGGVDDAHHGVVERTVGPVRLQRPAVEVGHPSAPSNMAALRPSDDADSALLAATLSRAYVSASVQDGPRRGDGVGGVGGGGAPGVGGGDGRGGRAHSLGEGSGITAPGDDPRYMQYLLEVQRRLAPLWANAFPREEMLALRQGTVVLNFTIARDGVVRGVSVQRRSGIAAFDENVRRAVAGARMPPIPAALGREELQVRAPFEFRNPAVRTLHQEQRDP